MRREPLDEGLRWLQQAEEDLRWARHLASEGGYHIACFLAQQVGEKALKGFLYAQGEAIVLGHSVGALCEKAARHLAEGLPDGIPAKTYNSKTALDAVELAEDIVGTVRRLIRAE
jgi:HEPN domain-containing protein